MKKIRWNYVEQKVFMKMNSLPVSKEIPWMLLIPNAHSFVHSNSPLVHIINQMQPVHTFPTILRDSC